MRDGASRRSAPKPRKPRRTTRDDTPKGEQGDEPETRSGVDPAVLPPSIGSDKIDEGEPAEPKPRRRTRKPKSSERFR